MTDTWAPGTNDWVPTTDPQVLRVVGKLLEETSELTKILARIILQGLDGVDPATTLANHESLPHEIADVLANIDLAIAVLQLDGAAIAERKFQKKTRLTKWLLTLPEAK